jgi:hypothetical protein
MRNVTPYRATGTPDANAGSIYGQGGLFGVPGVNPVLVNAMVNPIGIDRILQWVGTDEEQPLYDALVYIGSTGHTQESGCATCGKPYWRECMQTAVFGRFCQQTPEMQFDQIGTRLNRGVPRMSLYGSITDPTGSVLVAQGQEIRDVFALSVASVAYNLRMIHGQMLWTGNPVNNAGGYQEFKGFDLLINTGHFDAITGLACNALDSYISDFGSAVVGDTGSPSIVTAISGMLRSINYRISGMGKNSEGATTYLVMSPMHWEVVARAWACEYGLTCNVGATVAQDALEIAALRDQFMSTMQIPVDGRMYPVVLDNLMATTQAAYGNTTKFCGDIYAITTTLEGETIIWGEYQNFETTGGAVIADLRALFGATPIAVTDGGKFLHAPTFSGGICFDVRTFTKPRLIARMPQLSGRLQNVCVVPVGTYPAPTGSGLYGELTGGSSIKPNLYVYP